MTKYLYFSSTKNHLAGQKKSQTCFHGPAPKASVKELPTIPSVSKVMGGGENCRSSTVEIWDAQGQWRPGPEMRPGSVVHGCVKMRQGGHAT